MLLSEIVDRMTEVRQLRYDGFAFDAQRCEVELYRALLSGGQFGFARQVVIELERDRVG
jgi:hypothetical protein